jgi:dTDP-4-dehydrorhamnose 3,5-epimerase
MIFTAAAIGGAWIIDIDPHTDERGFFARTFDRQEFAAHGLETEWVQCSVSTNILRGTVRGLHYQREPHAERKLVRCTRGAIHDVLVDLRPASPTFGRHCAVELSAANHRSVYIPAGVAHGYQTLADDTEVTYHITPEYVPAAAAGVRFDDPALAVAWPLPVTLISARDRSLPAAPFTAATVRS